MNQAGRRVRYNRRKQDDDHQEDIADELAAVLKRDVERVDDIVHEVGPLELRRLTQICDAALPSVTSRAAALRELLAAAAKNCARREAIEELFWLNREGSAPDREDRRQTTLEMLNRRYASVKSQQIAIRGLRRQLASQVVALPRPLPLEPPDDDLDSNDSSEPDLLGLITTELEQLREGLGVTIAKVRSSAKNLQRLRVAVHEHKHPAAGRSSPYDRAAATYSVLDCATLRNAGAHEYAVLRRTLNFGQFIHDLAERRQRLSLELGVTLEQLEAYEPDVYERFALNLIEMERSPCRAAMHDHLADPAVQIGDPHDQQRVRLGLITIERRRDERDRLIVEYLDEVPEARIAVLRYVDATPTSEDVWQMIASRVCAYGWNPPIGSAWHRSITQAGLPPAVVSAEAAAWLVGSQWDRWDRLLTDEAPEFFEVFGFDQSAQQVPFGEYKSQALDRFQQLVNLINAMRIWDEVMRPDASSEAKAPAPVRA